MVKSGSMATVLVLTLVGWAPFGVGGPAEARGLLEGNMMAPLEALSGECYQCRECVGDKHDIVDGQPENNKWESSHLENCNPGDCDLHESCEVETVAELNEVWLKGQDAGFATLRELSSNKEHVHLNLARGALQLLGCKGEVVASLPLQPWQLVDR
jgi:hypothetical protein